MPYMQRLMLGFCLGAIVPGLPWPMVTEMVPWAVAGALLALVAWVLPALRRRACPLWRIFPAGLVVGLIWSGLAHHQALDARLSAGPAGSLVSFSGRVLTEPVMLDTPAQAPPASRFQVRVVHQSAGPRIGAVGATVRLSWYGAPPVSRGDLWHLTAVLREPWSYANPGGFDYERWLLGEGIQGTGYVRAGERLQAAIPGALGRARLALTELVTGLELEHDGVLLALLLGDGSRIPQARWEVLRSTGTIHLMVVSGLHVSLAAVLGFAAGGALGRLCPWLLLWLNVRAAGCLGGAAVALGYVLLAGAGLPALRAMVMSAAALLLMAAGRTARLGAALLAALTVLLAVQPLAVHQQGFWLSFGAVGVLYLALGHRHGDGRLRSAARAQLGLGLAMLPVVALFTGSLPWTGVAANLLAVPVVTLVVVPATLLSGVSAAVSGWAAGWGLKFADLVVGGVFGWLDWLAQAPMPLAGGGALGLLVAQAGAACWLVGVPRAYLLPLALCWGLIVRAADTGIPHGHYRVMALDVGQGSAVVVDTRSHRLLFDAGPGFPSGFETGSAVVVPSLLATGPPRLNTLILSHDDLDHVGGARYVRETLEPLREVGPDSGPGSVGSERHGPDIGRRWPTTDRRWPTTNRRWPTTNRRWRWDGVAFRLLDVPRPAGASDNDRSRILLVDDGRHAMLIAGDAGASVEAGLLRLMAREQLTVHLMFAPHHGSSSSSSRALVRVLAPRLVFVSAGRGNRFGHPHPAVVARYRDVGARLYQTGRGGALIWNSHRPERVVCWRERARYWRGRDPGACPGS